MFCLFLIFFAVAIASPFPYSSDSTDPGSGSDDLLDNPKNVGLSRIPASSPDNTDVIATTFPISSESSDVTPINDYSPSNPDNVEESSVPANPQSDKCITDASTSDNVNLGLSRREGMIYCPARGQVTIPIPKAAPASNAPADSGKTRVPDPACQHLEAKPWLLTCGGPEYGPRTPSIFQVLNCVEGRFFDLP